MQIENDFYELHQNILSTYAGAEEPKNGREFSKSRLKGDIMVGETVKDVLFYMPTLKS